MPFFRFLMQGEGIRTKTDGIGFFSARDAEAETAYAAGVLALAVLREEWTNGVSAAFSPGNPPSLHILRCWPITPHVAGKFANSGHSFYTADPGAAEQGLDIELEAADAPG